LVAVPKLQAASSSELSAGHDRSDLVMLTFLLFFARRVDAGVSPSACSFARADLGTLFWVA
jgi:hypothetical protein